jgi:flagellar basal body rod protein FlgC
VTVGILEMCGTGFDEANACKNWNGERIRCVVLAASIGNIETTKQATGRSFRHKNPILIYPVDKDSNIRKHYGLINEWKKTGEIKPTFHNIVPEKITETICELSKNNGR